MNFIKPTIKSHLFWLIFISLFLCAYLTIGLYTELNLIVLKPIPSSLLEDFKIYEHALDNTLNGGDPYFQRIIGLAYLYPPPALFIVEFFHHIKPFLLKVSVFSVFNIGLLIFMVHGIARYYGLSSSKTWYWYVICLGFAPFLELLQIGQINLITLFGLFVLFISTETSSLLSGAGLGLAIITKVSPILFFGYALFQKKYKVLIISLILMCILTGLSILRFGSLPVLEYPEVFRWLINQFPLDQNSQSLVAKLATPGYPIQFQGAIPIFLRDLLAQINSVFSTDYQVIQRILTLYIFFIIFTSGLLTLYDKQPREPLFIITAFGMTLSANVMWYHHYVFLLLPLLIWMGWTQLDLRTVVWSLIGLLIIQFDRFFPPYGLLIHLFGHISILSLLAFQIRALHSSRDLKAPLTFNASQKKKIEVA
jgi:hypothetical protein